MTFSLLMYAMMLSTAAVLGAILAVDAGRAVRRRILARAPRRARTSAGRAPVGLSRR